MRRLLSAAVLLAFVTVPFASHAQQLTVFAAASLTDVMKNVDRLWQTDGHPALRMSFAASSTLARQIEQAAPVNLFASADEQWMDYLAKRGLIAADTRRDLLSNDLVLVMPADKAVQVEIKPGFDLAALLGAKGRLAVGDPAHVPAGIYAAQALKNLGQWDVAAPRLARSDDVRAALLLVERGEAAAGIVYGTDAAASKAVKVVGTFPANSHSPIAYPFAVVKAGDSPEARALMDFLDGPTARDVFARHGFKVD